MDTDVALFAQGLVPGKTNIRQPAADHLHHVAIVAAAITTISVTCEAPPGRNEEGPAAGGADRALGIAEGNHEVPVRQAGNASVAQVCVETAPAFPASNAEANMASRLSIAGWALPRANLADGGSRFIATGGGRDSAVMTALDAVDHIVGRVGAPL